MFALSLSQLADHDEQHQCGEPRTSIQSAVARRSCLTLLHMALSAVGLYKKYHWQISVIRCLLSLNRSLSASAHESVDPNDEPGQNYAKRMHQDRLGAAMASCSSRCDTSKYGAT
jgi:hypothetical protein